MRNDSNYEIEAFEASRTLLSGRRSNSCTLCTIEYLSNQADGFSTVSLDILMCDISYIVQISC